MTENERRIATRYPYRYVGVIRWITADGEHKAVRGEVTGKSTSAKGGRYLAIRVHGSGGEKVFAGYKGIIRALDAEQRTEQARQAVTAMYCQECGKKLDYHTDEGSGLEGYCFNCV